MAKIKKKLYIAITYPNKNSSIPLITSILCEIAQFRAIMHASILLIT
jgi:hypothetical protein